MNANVKKRTTVGVVIAAVGAAAIALGAGTFAAFSDTKAGPITNATAGTVVLTEGLSNSEALAMANLVPGDTTAGSKTLSYTNGGSAPATLTLALAVADIENGCNGDELSVDSDCTTTTSGGDLSRLLKVTVTKKVNGGDSQSVYPTGPVSGLPLSDGTSVDPGEKVEYTFKYSFPDSGPSDNAAQGDKTTVTTTATLSS